MGIFKLICLKYHRSHIAYIIELKIHPNFSRKGISRKMMQEIIDLAKEIGIKRLELSVGLANLQAQKCYEKSGFEKEGVLLKYTHLMSEVRFLDEVMMAWVS